VKVKANDECSKKVIVTIKREKVTIENFNHSLRLVLCVDPAMTGCHYGTVIEPNICNQRSDIKDDKNYENFSLDFRKTFVGRVNGIPELDD